MKTGRLLPLLVLPILASASVAFAESKVETAPREVIVRRQVGVPKPEPVQRAPRIRTNEAAVPNASFSVELSQVVRLQGLNAFYRTAVDIANNTSNGGVVAQIQFSYANAACTNGFCRSARFPIPLAALDNFHSDDMVSYLNQQGLLVPGAVDNAVGTLLITFENLPSNDGWEAIASARIYTRVDELDPSLGTIGYAFLASLFFDSARETVVGTVRDTTPAALANNTQGSQRTNMGIRNTDINGAFFPGTNRLVSAQITFYDVAPGSPTNGQRVGIALRVDNLAPGEIRLAGNVFSLAQIPTTISTCIAFIDVVSPAPSASSPTIEGFIVTIDNVTQDGSYFEMKCADVGFVCAALP